MPVSESRSARKPPIRALLLDIGGVLLTNGWDRKMRKQAAEIFGLDYTELDERHHLTFDTYEEGKLTLETYLNRVVFYQRRSFTMDEFRGHMFSQSKPLPDMIDLVRSLRRQYEDLRIGTVSNEGRELTEHRIRKFGLAEFIQFFVSSCFVHIRKPDEDIYKVALDMAQVSPDQTVYVDDRPLFVEVAQNMGIHGIIHTGRQSTQQALAELGLPLLASATAR